LAAAGRGGQLRATHTHLYPGARLSAAPGEHVVPRRGDRVLVVFADHGGVLATVRAVDGERFELALPSHTTRRGTVIAAKRWLIEPAPGGGYRVASRLAPAAG